MTNLVVSDFKYRTGEWARSFRVKDKVVYTVSACLYGNILNRCRDGKHREDRPSYEGCFSTFTDFQDFAEWCQNQIGYNKPGFQLDKDILLKGNKEYGKKTCCFVPQRLNALILNSKATR